MQANMNETYFMDAFFGLVFSFVFALMLAGVFKYFDHKDLNLHKKRAAHLRPTSRHGGLAVCLSLIYTCPKYRCSSTYSVS